MEALNFHTEPILAIETSCDETSAAVVHGSRVLSNVVASQTEMHAKWGGVVPEAASRAHVEALLPVLRESLGQAFPGLSLLESMRRLSGIAVTNRPGLVGALSVGVTAAKALALALEIPLLGIHHLEGHLSSVYAECPDIRFPYLSLVVSGGHTELVEVLAPGRYRILAETRDDAAGEAFDKGARLLGLGYPGGRRIEEAAAGGNPRRYALPRGTPKGADDFSFSGLKTAMLRLVEGEGDALSLSDAAAGLQEAIVDSLARRAASHLDASSGYQDFTLVGGVAANKALRERLTQVCHQRGLRFVVPPYALCTDNAAMIGLAASPRFARGESSGFDLDVEPSADLPQG